MNEPLLESFASRLLDWFDQHGRSGLPWQQPRTAYRVWLSEIMLQQTQVAAVIPYFERFIARFPDIRTLADADSDEVMRHWAGLGYYARARNLHAAARQVCDTQDGVFPSSFESIVSLKGVGRSTAAAILAQAFDTPAAILDGNVKRVLARWAGIEGHPAEATVNSRLWSLAESLLPSVRAADYVQAQMDLGATLCTARRPACARCPLIGDCIAHATQRTVELPTRKPRKPRPQQEAWLILAEDAEGRVLLEQRPGAGIWGGLWCPPVISLGDDRQHILRSRFGLALRDEEEGKTIQHQFTHFDLSLHPLRARAERLPEAVAEAGTVAWHYPQTLRDGVLALPAPISRYFMQDALPADLLGMRRIAIAAQPKRCRKGSP